QKAPAVGQTDGNPLRAVDDVMVGEDTAVGVDDEAGALAPPRQIAVALRLRRLVWAVEQAIVPCAAIIVVLPAAPAALAARLAGRVDVDEGGVHALHDVGEVDEGRQAACRAGGCDSPGVGARIDARGAAAAAGENGADQERDRTREDQRDDGEATRHSSVYG